MVRRGRRVPRHVREEAVPIAPRLVPYLEAAINDAPGEMLFAKLNGNMRTNGDALGERLRRALGRAGIVTGCLHSCRRCKARGVAKPHAEMHPDNACRRCPDCALPCYRVRLARPAGLGGPLAKSLFPKSLQRRARQDSNLWPAASKAAALSS